MRERTGGLYFNKAIILVIAKFKPEISEELRQQACNDVLKLKDQIPQITSVTAGKTFTNRSKGYEWGKQCVRVNNNRPLP